MMKPLTIAVLLLLAGCAGLQPIAESDRTFDAVFDVPDIPKAKIFTATKIWIAENFHSAKAVIEYENKDDGTVIGNGVIPYPCEGLECLAKKSWSVPFTMRVDMKDQKFKLTFSNVRLTAPPSYNATVGAQPGFDGPISQRDELDAIKPKLLAMGNELVASIRKNSGKKDW